MIAKAYNRLLAKVKNRCMPSRDIYHNHVKNALLKDGWTITHDPLKLEIAKKDLYIMSA
ncbi:element excision factor XisH family protein [Nostoc sp.]|uniref:element excision factor XisH family protein n=1 Tax=Nostoc sp. TaxID=1180 RepID=UPI002FF4747C